MDFIAIAVLDDGLELVHPIHFEQVAGERRQTGQALVDGVGIQEGAITSDGLPRSVAGDAFHGAVPALDHELRINHKDTIGHGVEDGGQFECFAFQRLCHAVSP